MSGSWGNTASGKAGSSGSSGKGGWGNTAGGKVSSSVASPKKGGGLLGRIGRDLSHVSDPFKWVGEKTGQAARDIAQIPTGMVQAGQAEYSAIKSTIEHPLVSKSKFNQMYKHPLRPVEGTANTKQITALGAGAVKSTVQTVEHPLRDPFQTAMIAMTAASGLASVARFGAAASEGLAGAESAMSMPRTLKVPRVEAPVSGVAPEAIARASGQVTRLTNLRLRAMQTGDQARAAQLGARLDQARTQLEGLQKPAEGPVNVRRSTVQLAQGRSPLAHYFNKGHDYLAQKALDNTTVRALTGGPGETTHIAKYALSRVAKATAEAARPTENLRAATPAILEHAKVGGQGVSKAEGQLALNLRSGNVLPHEAASFWAGKEGEMAARNAQLAQSLHEKGVLHLNSAGNVEVNAAQYPRLAQAEKAMVEAQGAREQIIRQNSLMTDEGITTRKNLMANTMGVDRQGQGFVSLKTSEARAPQNPVARSAGSTIPQTKRFSVGKRATGRGIEQGLIPAETTKVVARGLRSINRFQNTKDLRGKAYRLGSDLRQTKDDLLVAHPDAKVAALPEEIKQALGKTESTLTPVEERNLRAHLDSYAKQLITHNDTAAIGERAPQGWRWVNKHAVPDTLRESPVARGKLERGADTINSAVTFATVYAKIGHLPQRLITNATTNFVQGGLHPVELLKTWKIARQLDDTTKVELTSLTGTHGYQALPAQGVNAVARMARKGAGGWARHIDAPFRLNSILFELRRIGVTTPEEIKSTIRTLSDPARSGKSGSEIMKLDGAVRRANRAAMMYDGLSVAEKRYVSRYVWFYPWTKAAMRFAGHTAVEHPFKSLVLGEAGVQGRKKTESVLGAMPSFESGLSAVGGGANPLTTNLSTLVPYGTVPNVLDTVRSPLGQEGIAGSANPIWAGVIAGVTTGRDRGTQQGLLAGLGQAISPTPELQIAAAGLKPHQTGGSKMFPTSSQYLFGRTWQSTGLRALVGAGFPRRVNVQKLNTYAAREHQKKKTITIYQP